MRFLLVLIAGLTLTSCAKSQPIVSFAAQCAAANSGGCMHIPALPGGGSALTLAVDPKRTLRLLSARTRLCKRHGFEAICVAVDDDDENAIRGMVLADRGESEFLLYVPEGYVASFQVYGPPENPMVIFVNNASSRDAILRGLKPRGDAGNK